MALQPGQELAFYQITALLGKGGMGEVYRAHDFRLKRDVAIKILPDPLSGEPERVERFQREAEVLAALNHPNIAAIYDLQREGETRFLVLEYVEGDTLAEVLRRRRGLPLDEACGIARQICLALEAAHEKGIVHRDLKPANVKITPDGTTKVLDFGLAKALDPGPGGRTMSDALSNSPTLSLARTGEGVILGTAAYMAPEQAKGLALDRRADIFAFGSVLYEMLTGKPAFDGDDVAEILGSVLKTDPDWSRLPARTPPSILRLLHRALRKDPRRRLGDIRDAWLDIEEALTPLETETPSRRRDRWFWGLLAAAAVLVAVLAIPAVRHYREVPGLEMRLEIPTPPTFSPLSFALSPDGRYLVFDGRGQLWLRRLDQLGALPIKGTEGAESPFWSADSKSIGFFTPGKLFVVDVVAGGSPRYLTAVSAGKGGAWNQDGTILFSQTAASPLLRISARGGEPTPVTRLDSPRQSGHRLPQFLPDGRHFLFYATGLKARGIYLGTLDGGQPTYLTAADAAGVYLHPNRVAFVRQGVLMAQQLDLSQKKLLGEPVTLADSVGSDAQFAMSVSVSSDGTLIAFRPVGAVTSQLTWLDRKGNTLSEDEPDGNSLRAPDLSPDGRRVAIERRIQNERHIFVMDRVRGGLSRFTFDADNANPTWSADGTQIAYTSNRRDGVFNVYIKSSSLAGPEQLLLQSPNTQVPQDWSKNGFLLYYELFPQTGRDIQAVNVNVKERRPIVVANTHAEETMAEFSPDGRWVAYQTNISGQYEIIAQSFPQPGDRVQVSLQGGVAPRWSSDGREICFVSPNGMMMAVRVTVSGNKLDAGKPIALFPTRIVEGGAASSNRPQYDVRDGRFLLNQSPKEPTVTPIVIVVNGNLANRN